MCKETSLCNTICLIIEFLREHLIEITKLLILQNLCMKSCNTVDRITSSHCKVRHLNLSIIENRHFAYFLIIVREFLLNIKDKSAVNLIYNLVHTWKKSLENFDWPFLKSLSHNGMVCICNRFCCNLPCIIP